MDKNTIIADTTVYKYHLIAASVVLYHEYLLTLTREVAWIWGAPQQLSWTNLMFYFNRYFSFFGHITVLFRAFWPPNGYANKAAVCVQLFAFETYLAVITQTAVGVFLLARTYAIYRGNRLVLTALCLAAAGVMANGLWSVVTGKGFEYTPDELVGFDGCVLPLNDSHARRFATAWVGVLAFDALIFVLTLHKSMKEIRYGGSQIMRILLRDGAMYFGVLTMASTATIVAFLSLGPYGRGNVAVWNNTLASVLMSRLILNLRDPTLCSRYVPETGYTTDPVMTTWLREPGFHADDGSLPLPVSDSNINTRCECIYSMVHDDNYDHGWDQRLSEDTSEEVFPSKNNSKTG